MSLIFSFAVHVRNLKNQKYFVDLMTFSAETILLSQIFLLVESKILTIFFAKAVNLTLSIDSRCRKLAYLKGFEVFVFAHYFSFKIICYFLQTSVVLIAKSSF